MINIQKLLENKKHLKTSAVIFAFILVLFFSPVSSTINNTLQGFFQRIAGQSTPDSDLVIIHIDAEDIEKLGSWPLKRSYYALLISQLKQYDVKGIGIEIFLSDKMSFQSVYNQLLLEQISDAPNIVLSSQLYNLVLDGDDSSADSIIYPQPKLVNQKLNTGHLHYIDSKGIYVPTKIEVAEKNEYAFSSKVAGLLNDELLDEKIIKLNFDLSWEKFERYSLIEFFALAEENSAKLKSLQNKFILIGVSDPSTAKFISTPFDESLPGIGLHAIAVDNIINGKTLNEKILLPSSIIFFLIFLFVAYQNLSEKEILCCVAALAILLLVSFFVFVFLNVELNYSAFLLPFAFLVAAELLISNWENRFELSNALSQTEVLKIALRKKENDLSAFEKRLVAEKNPDDELISKISELKKEIDELKKSREEDQTPVDEFKETKNFEGIIYSSSKFDGVIKTISKVAPTEAGVLILGESGSGKELVAKAIHNLSNRKGNNFFTINCAAVSDSLLESELFGHVKGAFTNASADKLGMFEAADKGTIFLDEIGETSENFQVKLLRVLQSGEIQKVGSTKNIIVDVRIIAATNKNLEKLVAEKLFREDLFYRLNVIQVNIPPLRERKEDIQNLANYFAKSENKNLVISKAVIKQLEKNDWKGNVRELESTIKRASIFAASDGREIIKLVDLPDELVKFDKSNIENLILESLREKKFSHSSINETARELGNLSRTIVSENFRGIFFKYYCSNDFNLDSAVMEIAATDELLVLDKVKSKVSTYLKNLSKDLKKSSTTKFDETKAAFNSKYKNLPKRYHQHLDNIIKHLLES